MSRNTYKNKTVLVTGDTGFKGSWLAIWLKELGANVIGFSLPPKTNRDNYVVCKMGEKITHIDGDIRDYHHLESTIRHFNPDFIFHLAAQALVIDGYHHPRETYSTNIMGTVNVLEAIKHKSVKGAIIVTSDKCYENKEMKSAYTEDDSLGGHEPYSASKAACEIIVKSYQRSFFNSEDTANIASVRAGNVIGGGDWCANRIIPDCIRSLENKIPIFIRNPKAVRPWQHVLEPLSGYLKLGKQLIACDTFSGAWNFGPKTKNAVTVEKLVNQLITHWGSGEVSFGNIQNGPTETILLYLDISKALGQLDWQPKWDLDKTLEQTISGYNIKNLKGNRVYDQRVAQIDHYQKTM